MLSSCPSPLTSIAFPLRRSHTATTTVVRLSSGNSSASSSSNESSHTEAPILRRHNSKSTSLLLHHLSPQHQLNPEILPQSLISPEEKIKLLEMSLVTKRTPQFPGSIYVQSPSDSDVTASLPPIQSLFENETSGEDEGVDEEMVMRAIDIRRKVTVEIFKQAMMRNGKFGITYSSNLINKVPEFVDYLMIQAAELKRVPELSSSSFNVRARTVIEESNVVPLIRWLKHNSLSYPQIGKLICMSKRNLDSIRQLAEWLKLVHVKGRFVGIALLKAGENIFKRSNEELDEIVEHLESKGVRREWMGYVIGRCPQLLSFSMEELETREEFYFGMGMNENDFGTMVFDYPRALGYFTMEDMNRKVKYLKEFGLGDEDVGKLLAFKPQLMGCSIEERWIPLVKYLYYLGITRDGMRRILTIKPMVFCVDLEATIVPKVRFFQDMGIPDDAIGNMLVKFPPLLTYSLHKKIRPVVIFLMTRAGVNERDIAKVIALGPEILGCSIANKLEGNVKYFLSLGVDLRQLGEMIADFPMLLRYNVNVLRPKYRYLRRTMIRPLEDVIEFPRFFSYSLDGRIIPRHKILVENRINFKLRYMLASSDEEFNKKVEAAIERRHRFESRVLEDTFSDCQRDEISNRSLQTSYSSTGTLELDR